MTQSLLGKSLVFPMIFSFFSPSNLSECQESCVELRLGGGDAGSAALLWDEGRWILYLQLPLELMVGTSGFWLQTPCTLQSFYLTSPCQLVHQPVHQLRVPSVENREPQNLLVSPSSTAVGVQRWAYLSSHLPRARLPYRAEHSPVTFIAASPGCGQGL